MNFDKFGKLLKEASNIMKKIPVKEKTFMDVSGYPHYENVCSNILAFYFDPNGEHKLNELFINSIIKIIERKNKSLNIDFGDILNNTKVYREYVTSKGNRIDLVIQNDNFVIGIENKIYASVTNDLDDYANTLNKLNNNSIKILLSLFDNTKEIKNTEFINVTYQEFFYQLKEELKNLEIEKNKWYIFLDEFIKNLVNFEGELEMEEEIINWLKVNQKELDEFDKIREIIYKSMEKKQEKLKGELEKSLKVDYIKIWKGRNEIVSYIDSPYKYHVDANLSSRGWRIGIFTWTSRNSNIVKQIIENSKYNIIEDESNHRWLYQYEYNTPSKEILNKLLEIYNYMEMELEKTK